MKISKNHSEIRAMAFACFVARTLGVRLSVAQLYALLQQFKQERKKRINL